jgi:general stress protein 26
MAMGPKTERDQAIRKLAELIGEIRVAMLTTVTEDGALWSRPLLTQRARFDGDLWFITKAESAKVREVQQHRRVSLSYAKPEANAYVTVAGTAQVVSDPKKAEELWDASYQRWFPGGPSDPDLALIRVSAERAEYWEAPTLTWPFVAGFVVTAPDQTDDPEFHARIVLKKD